MAGEFCDGRTHAIWCPTQGRETMASLRREFGISTGYKIFERYQQCGLEGLSDRVRRPLPYANQLPEQVEAAIVSAKWEKPHWGARKIRSRNRLI